MQTIHTIRRMQYIPEPLASRPALNQPFADNKEGQLKAQQAFSEIVITSDHQQFLALLAPVLQSLSNNAANRWLTLVAPPETITNQWLRSININPNKTIVINENSESKTLKLLRQTLSLGLSHTVVSWLDLLPEALKKQLSNQAAYTQSKWLNIKHPFTIAC